MALERFGLIKFGGVERTVVGPDLKPGDPAPDFVAVNNDWADVRPLQASAGKVVVVASILSFETDVCDREVRRFNTEATRLGPDVHVYVVSMDLPYTQKRWCGAAGVDQVTVLSDHMTTDFGMKYGVLIKEARLLRRAVFVVDRAGKLTYVAYMPALGVEPDYAEVLAAAKAALE